MDATLSAALTTYTGSFGNALLDAVPVVASAAAAFLVLKLGINYGMRYFKKFAR